MAPTSDLPTLGVGRPDVSRRPTAPHHLWNSNIDGCLRFVVSQYFGFRFGGIEAYGVYIGRAIGYIVVGRGGLSKSSTGVTVTRTLPLTFE